MSAPLTFCCLYSVFHLALKLFSCHFQGHYLKGHPKIVPTADLYSRLYATAQLYLHFMHITLPSSVYGLRFLFYIFGFLFLSPESGEIFNEALEGLHWSTGQLRQLLTSLATTTTTTTSRAAAASRSSISVGALLPRPKQVKGSQTY